VAAVLDPRQRLRSAAAGPLRTQLAALGTAAAIGALLAWLMEHRPYDTWAVLPVAFGVVAVSLPLLRRAVALEDDPRIGRMLWWAFAAKLAASVPRYIVAFGVYDGSADANAYSRIGAGIARQFRDGDFTVDLGKEVQGTGFIELLTGYVYTVIGATTLGGFLVFSWFGFWGLYLLHRAFVRAVPDGDHRRYALLVFFMPSLLFWPSSIGKEAWMSFGIGVVAYAASRLLTGARGGLLLLALGSLMLGMVRPHVAAILGFAVFTAFLVRRPPQGASIFAPLGKLAIVVVLGLAMAFAVGQLEDFLGLDEFDQDAVVATLEDVERRTGQGGSQFVENSDTDLDPSRLPQALINVMFRPFPWQATNVQALISSVEGVFLLVLLLASWRRLATAVMSLLRRPYVVLCGVYTLLFVFGFSSFSNAGILVRQRVQVLPFVLAVVCLPRLRDLQRERRSMASTASSTAS
jgi:hypothetical protein